MLRTIVREASHVSLSHARGSAINFLSSSSFEFSKRLAGIGSQRAFASKQEEPTFLDSIISSLGVLERREPDKYNGLLRKMIHEFNSYNQVMPDFRLPRENHLLDKLEDRTRLFWNRFYTKFACFRSITGWKTSQVEEAAKETFMAVNEAVASGNVHQLESIKDLMTHSCYNTLRSRVNKLPPRLNVTWEGEVTEVKIMDGDYDKLFSETVRNQLLQNQITAANSISAAHFVVKLVSKQKYKVTNSAGVVVAGGDESKVYEDYWVFERLFFRSYILRKPGPMGARWRLLAQLSAADLNNTGSTVAGGNQVAKVTMGLGAVVVAVAAYINFLT